MKDREESAAVRAQLAMQHERCMRLALAEAEQALREDEVPVGAALMRGDTVLASAHNLCAARRDPMAHAEMLCLTEGVRQCGGYLSDCTLYVTLEPCVMCAGAAIQARLGRLVFGAFDPRAGCCGSVLDITDRCFYHSIPVWGGVLEGKCAALLSAFFAGKRDHAANPEYCKQENEP